MVVADGEAGRSRLADLLYMLPTELLEDVIGKYLRVDDWGKIDTALCTSHPLRGIYLNVLKSKIVELSVDNSEFWNMRLDKGIWKWIVARCVPVISWKNRNNYVRTKPMANERLSLLDISLSRHLTDAEIISIMKSRLHNLQSLNIRNCAQITDVGVAAIVSGAPNLVSLNICYCEDVTDNGLILISTGLPRLLSLEINACGKVSDIGIKSVAEELFNLQTLDIGACRKITDAGLIFLANNLSNLTSVVLAGGNYGSKLTDAGLTYIADKLHNLHSLHIGSCKLTDAGLEAISHGFPNLQSLVLKNCRHIHDSGIRVVAAGLHKLLKLSVIGCEKITDIGVAIAVNGVLQKLQCLNIIGCERSSEIGLTAIVNSGLPSLLSLDINSCAGNSDAVVEAIVYGLPYLQSLNISGRWSEPSYTRVTDRGLELIAKGIRNLECLTISFCDKCTDNGIVAIINGSLRLKSFDIAGCREVTDAGLATLFNLPSSNLQVLNIQYCNKISNACVTAISNELPNLKIILTDE